MRRIFIGAVVLTMAGAFAQQAAAAVSRERVEDVVKSAQRAFDREHPNVPGMAIGVVTPAGSKLRTQVFTFGTRDAAKPSARVRSSTLFEIGSVTKVFTSTLLTDAERRGLLMRNTLAQSLMAPGTRLPTHSCGVPMTLQQLAAHRAGFQKALPGFKDPVLRATLTPDQLFARVAPLTLNFCPGTRSQYSNIGFGLLGTLVARAQGRTYADLLRERITAPLGMTATRPEDDASSRLSKGHCNNARAAERWNNIGALAGGGGLMSSITDMTRFISGHLGGGPADVVANLAATRLKVAGSTVKGDGLGWKFRAISGVKGLFYTKNGGTPGFRSVLKIAPDERFGIVILANAPTSPDALGDRIAARVLQAKAINQPVDGGVEQGC